MTLHILLAVLILVAFAADMVSARMDFENAVAIWLFDDGAGGGVVDSSGNDNNGTIMGDSKWVDGKFGKALEFDGATTIVDCGAGESLDFVGQTNFSISVWAKSDTNNITDGMFVWKALGCSTWAQYGFGVGAIEANSVAPNKLNFYYRVNNSGTEEIVVDEGNFPADEWVHAVGTYDGEKLRIYMNGQMVADQDSSGIPWASTEHVYIGGDPGCGVRYIWSGALDELMIFNKTLTEDEVKDLMKGYEMAGTVFPAGKLATTWSNIRAQ
jgi:hypothetical protein